MQIRLKQYAYLILVHLTALNLTPVLTEPIRNIVPNLVYAASGHEVVTVMVAGKTLVRDRQALTADIDTHPKCRSRSHVATHIHRG